MIDGKMHSGKRFFRWAGQTFAGILRVFQKFLTRHSGIRSAVWPFVIFQTGPNIRSLKQKSVFCQHKTRLSMGRNPPVPWRAFSSNTESRPVSRTARLYGAVQRRRNRGICGRLRCLKAALQFIIHSIAQNSLHEKALFSLRGTEKSACLSRIYLVLIPPFFETLESRPDRLDPDGSPMRTKRRVIFSAGPTGQSARRMPWCCRWPCTPPR